MRSFNTKKFDDSSSLRIGKTVPDGDVNLAYVYAKPINIKDNVQLVDCAGSLVENLSRLLKQEVVAVADTSGQLYEQWTPRLDFRNLILTDLFKDYVFDVEHALYYCYNFIHYDVPGLNGKYDNDSIVVTDSGGNQLLPEEYYEIYLTPTDNPAIYNGIIYTSFLGDAYKIRYNKVIDGEVKPGYQETLNTIPVYQYASLREVLNAQPSQKIYAVTDMPDGYLINVPQKGVDDTRDWQLFDWRLTAIDSNNDTYTFGWVKDRILPVSCLTNDEKGDYGDGVKYLTVDGLTVREIIEKILPADFEENVIDYTIESNNSNISVLIPDIDAPAEAVIPVSSSEPLAIITGSKSVERPIQFSYTIIPKKYNILQWDWEAYGSGLIGEEINEGDNLWTCEAVEYISKVDESDGETVVYTVNEQTQIKDCTIPVGQQYVDFSGLCLLTNYNSTENSNYQTLYSAEHNNYESISMDKGMPYKRASFSVAVWVEQAAGISLEFYHSDWAQVYLNDFLIYDCKTAYQPVLPLHFETGWNQLIINYTDTQFDNITNIMHIDNDTERKDNSNLILIQSLTTLLEGTAVNYMVNSEIPAIEEWQTQDKLKGTANAYYNGGWVVDITPSTLPLLPDTCPEGLREFKWEGINCSSYFAQMYIENNIVKTNIIIDEYKEIGKAATFTDTILKSDGLKYLVDIDDVIETCQIPVGENPESIFLEMHLGDIYKNKLDERVNLRWFNNDTFYNEIVSLQDAGQVVAWTNYSDVIIAPVFAAKSKNRNDKCVYVDTIEPEDDQFDHWYLGINDGVFVLDAILPMEANYEACPELIPYRGELLTLRYSLPEYYFQDFNPSPPYVQCLSSPLTIIDNNTLQTKYSPLYQINKVMVNLDSPNERSLSIANVNRAEGIVSVNESIHDTDIVTADYIYENTFYNYRGYYAFDKFFHLNLNPSPGHTFTVIGDRIIPGDFPSLNIDEPREISASHLLKMCIYVYMRPSAILHNDKIISGSVRHNTIFHTTEGGYFDSQNILYDPTVFLLARVYVRPSCAPGDVITLDTRVRGGGLNDKYHDDNYWDMGTYDGTAYPAQGVILVRLPKNLLIENGGRFTETQVEEVVNRYLAYGVCAVIDYF